MAVGLGSMDMPIPQIAAWEWVNWRFPMAVKAGETIYARWTLTQKRPPVHGALAAIAVWRVDVHTAEGAVCAEGEIGASVFRRSAPRDQAERAPEATAPGAPARRRRGRRRPSTAEGAQAAPPVPAPPAPAPAERTGSPRRRRRRRPAAVSGNGDSAPAASPIEAAAPALPPPVDSTPPAPVPASPLSRVIRRLRR
jgi:hypothetical protein